MSLLVAAAQRAGEGLVEHSCRAHLQESSVKGRSQADGVRSGRRRLGTDPSPPPTLLLYLYLLATVHLILKSVRGLSH